MSEDNSPSGYEKKSRPARWYNQSQHWTKEKISKVLKKNPGIQEALDLLGIPASELVARAEEKENRRRQIEERANLLSAHASPDRRVGPATKVFEHRPNAKVEAAPGATVEAQKERLDNLLQRVVVEKFTNVQSGGCKIHADAEGNLTDKKGQVEVLAPGEDLKPGGRQLGELKTEDVEVPQEEQLQFRKRSLLARKI